MCYFDYDGSLQQQCSAWWSVGVIARSESSLQYIWNNYVDIASLSSFLMQKKGPRYWRFQANHIFSGFEVHHFDSMRDQIDDVQINH